MIKLCMFDLDGTLADTLNDLADSMNFALNNNGFEIHPAQAYKKFVGDGVYKLIERACPNGNKSDFEKIKDDFDNYYACHSLDKTKRYNDTDKLLFSLRDKGILCGVLSNKPHMFVKGILDKLYPGFDFACSLGKSDSYPCKPDPTLLLKTVSDLGFSRNECFYIGDSNVDIITGKNAGMKTIGVSWGFRGRAELENEGADFVVDNALDILEIIDKEK